MWKICQQKMGNIPANRPSGDPPFTFCGVDMFGPFLVKDDQKIQKRHEVMFACLSSRTVQIKMTGNLTRNNFIHALRRLISRRGNVRMIQSDSGTNFVG